MSKPALCSAHARYIALNGARKLGAAQLLLCREGEQTLKRIRNQASLIITSEGLCLSLVLRLYIFCTVKKEVIFSCLEKLMDILW